MRKKIAGTAINPAFREYVDMIINAALAEDIGEADVTTDAIAGPKETCEAVIIAKEDCVCAGLFVAERVFKTIDKNVSFHYESSDGERIRKGSVMATVSGRLAAVLTGERVALNFLQRLSGIATLTAAYVKKAGGRVKILDTRKTTPCLRTLERYAVMAGGGVNHRMGLYDAVLVKDNHIKAAGTVTEAMERVRRNYRGKGFVEVEVTTMREVQEALRGRPDVIMLDNMGLKAIKKAVAIIAGQTAIEVSGGVTLDTVAALSRTGVDRISVGGLTHSANAIDISMEVVSICRQKRRQRRVS